MKTIYKTCINYLKVPTMISLYVSVYSGDLALSLLSVGLPEIYFLHPESLSNWVYCLIYWTYYIHR